MDKRKMLIALCAVIFAAGVLGCFWVLRSPAGTKVRVSQDGKVLYSFDLSRTEDQTLDIVYEGRANTLEISDGRIRVQKAQCPDQVCVKSGWLDSSAPIICLPNHLVVEFADSASETDAVAQ